MEVSLGASWRSLGPPGLFLDGLGRSLSASELSWAVLGPLGALLARLSVSLSGLGTPGDAPGRAGDGQRGIFTLARAAPGIIVQMTSGFTFASDISLSSPKARCHCSLFSHALIPAL